MILFAHTDSVFIMSWGWLCCVHSDRGFHAS